MARYTDVNQFKNGDVVLVNGQDGISGVFRVVIVESYNLACETISHTVDNPLDDIPLHDCEGLVDKINGKNVGWFVLPNRIVTKLL